MILQQLSISSDSDRQVACSLLTNSADYRLHTYGQFTHPTDGHKLFTGFPGECAAEDRIVWALVHAGKPLGLIQLARHYPSPGTVHIGLLLIDPQHRGEHLGCQAIEHLTHKIRTWRNVTEIQLGVLSQNTAAIKFWQHCGFRTRRTECREPGILGDGLIMSRAVKAKPACKGGRIESDSNQAHAHHLFCVRG